MLNYKNSIISKNMEIVQIIIISFWCSWYLSEFITNHRRTLFFNRTLNIFKRTLNIFYLLRKKWVIHKLYTECRISVRPNSNLNVLRKGASLAWGWGLIFKAWLGPTRVSSWNGSVPNETRWQSLPLLSLSTKFTCIKDKLWRKYKSDWEWTTKQRYRHRKRRNKGRGTKNCSMKEPR